MGLLNCGFWKILFFAIFVFIPLSTAYGGVGAMLSLHNEEISEKTRDEIHVLNETLIKSIKEQKAKVMYDLFVDEGRKKGIAPIEKLYGQMGKVVQEKTFKIVDEYHIRYKGFGKTTFPVPSETTPKFFMHVSLSSREPKFVSLMETKDGSNEHLLVFTYEKVEKKWRLHGFHWGMIRVGGKTSIEWIRVAKEISEKGHCLPALLRLTVAKQFLRPAPFIQYEAEGDFTKVEDRCKPEMKKYKFPLKMNLEKNPEVFGIGPQVFGNDLVPIVNYISQNPLTEEEGFKKEGEKMLVLLKEIFPGIANYSQHLILKAFSELPSDPKKQYRSYGVVIDLTKK